MTEFAKLPLADKEAIILRWSLRSFTPAEKLAIAEDQQRARRRVLALTIPADRSMFDFLHESPPPIKPKPNKMTEAQRDKLSRDMMFGRLRRQRKPPG